MKALLDTCVILDAIQSRKPFARDAEAIFLAAAGMRFEGCVTAKSMTDIYYLSHRLTHDSGLARTIVSRIAELFDVLDTAGSDVLGAIASDTADFEDAVMIETALREHMDCIVTRNERDYRHSPVQVVTPEQFLRMLAEDAE
ncbi:MAG: PIN domain-containing protein [Clostridia bacterium]|nr:PIN domain-containing protein [Clostridia bacterium]